MAAHVTEAGVQALSFHSKTVYSLFFHDFLIYCSFFATFIHENSLL